MVEREGKSSYFSLCLSFCRRKPARPLALIDIRVMAVRAIVVDAVGVRIVTVKAKRVSICKLP